MALGLGDLRGQPNLGEGVRVEVDILGDDKAVLDASCFQLIKPANSDFPWLKRATLTVRKGPPRVLEIRSDAPLREPIAQLAVQVACGHEIVKEYILLASPARANPPVETAPASAGPVPSGGSAPVAEVRRSTKSRPPVSGDVPVRLAPRKLDKRSPVDLSDRVLLSGDMGVGEPTLRLSTTILAEGGEAKEAQREILRLEYRMLMAMHEQATSQLETAEKLRNMEASLGELRARASDVALNAEREAPPVVSAPAVPPAPVVLPKPQPVPPPSAPVDDGSLLSEWSLYGVLLGALLGLGGWLGWRRYQERQQDAAEEGGDTLAEPSLEIDPQRESEHEEPGGVDLHVEPAAMGAPMQVDFELDAPAEPSHVAAETAAKGAVLDSLMSISATTLDEHFEANPVMELADIMLSFGRVKGAAQALQEYIDNNPQEALQPWIRLMDVYRMAGMREEFEAVSRNLNQNFNVEVQRWEPEEAVVAKSKERSLDLVLDEQVEPVASVPPRPNCLEDMPRLMNMICEQWHAGDVVGYLYQLLRDNRGGQRIGFALPVVEEILFLIELRETANRMEKESGGL